jgi:hypothetical protein
MLRVQNDLKWIIPFMEAKKKSVVPFHVALYSSLLVQCIALAAQPYGVQVPTPMSSKKVLNEKFLRE